MASLDAKNSEIRAARPDEACILTDLAFASMQYWQGSDAYCEIWKEKRAVSPEYIVRNDVLAAECNGQILGFAALVHVPKGRWQGKAYLRQGIWLEQLIVAPESVRRGVGRRLLDAAAALCREKGELCFYSFSDPCMAGFYQKWPAEYLGESFCDIPDRTLSLFRCCVTAERMILPLEEDDLFAVEKLVWPIFLEFDAPDDSPEGVETFRRFLSPLWLGRKLSSGETRMWGCFQDKRMVGVLAVRNPGHISLLFVKKEYHRQGVARALWKQAWRECSASASGLTVNASPYAVAFYRKLGFREQGLEQIVDGIRFTPMKYGGPGVAV